MDLSDFEDIAVVLFPAAVDDVSGEAPFVGVLDEDDDQADVQRQLRQLAPEEAASTFCS